MSLASVYTKGVVTRAISISINDVGSNIKEILESDAKRELEGKCCKDGYVQPDSVNVVSYSSGKIFAGSKVQFEVVLEANFALPVEGMLIDCLTNNISKAGIKAGIRTTGDESSPLVIFISRDHFHSDDYFLSIKEGDKITVRVIGQRFELNDPFISVIAELVKPKQKAPKAPKEGEPYVVLE